MTQNLRTVECALQFPDLLEARVSAFRTRERRGCSVHRECGMLRVVRSMCLVGVIYHLREGTLVVRVNDEVLERQAVHPYFGTTKTLHVISTTCTAVAPRLRHYMPL